MVSHNLRPVRALCARALLVEDGRVVEDGPTGQVVGRYHEVVMAQRGVAGAAGTPLVGRARAVDGMATRPVRSTPALSWCCGSRWTTRVGAGSVVHGVTVQTADGEPVYADSSMWEPVA